MTGEVRFITLWQQGLETAVRPVESTPCSLVHEALGEVSHVSDAIHWSRA
jgi:hypothetical protein